MSQLMLTPELLAEQKARIKEVAAAGEIKMAAMMWWCLWQTFWLDRSLIHHRSLTGIRRRRHRIRHNRKVDRAQAHAAKLDKMLAKLVTKLEKSDA